MLHFRLIHIYDNTASNKDYLIAVNGEMRKHLKENWRCDPSGALDWCRPMEHGSVTSLCDKNLLFAPIFIDLARAFLSAQSSSASCERLLGDSGHQEGQRRQQTEDMVSEMLLMIPSSVKSKRRESGAQKGFPSAPADAVKQLAEQVTVRIVQT